VYKFTGDGWLILFPASMVDGTGLMRFLFRLVAKHNALRAKLVDIHLESIPASNGLTIGVEMGEVRKFFLDDQIEFTGRAFNIACRLQAAVKEKDAEPDYRCLFSRKVFNTYLTKVKDFEFADVERSLRNISDGERYCGVKVDLSAHVRA
jgi:hypothetical protein